MSRSTTTTSRHTPSSLACFSWIPTSRKPKESSSLRARRVLHEDPRDELPETGLLHRFHEGHHRKRACPTASGLAGRVHGELGHAGVAPAGAVGRRVGEGDHHPLILHHHDRMPPIEPLQDLVGRAQTSLERRDALLDALVVDAGYGFRVFRPGCPGLHDSILTPSLAPTPLAEGFNVISCRPYLLAPHAHSP